MKGKQIHTAVRRKICAILLVLVCLLPGGYVRAGRADGATPRQKIVFKYCYKNYYKLRA